MEGIHQCAFCVRTGGKHEICGDQCEIENLNRKTLHMKFLRNQSGEDLYRCEETGRVYVRQPSNIRGPEKLAFWLSGSPWSGGVEADCPLRAGITISFVDPAGTECEETLYPDTWNGGTSARKAGKFSWETD